MNPPTGSSASAAQPAADGIPLPKPSSPLDLENLTPGSRWHGVYQMGEQLPDVTYGRVFKALHVGVMNDVVIRSFRVSDDLRARTWEKIRRAQNGGLLELVEAIESEGRRIEVIQAAPALTLREWASRRKAGQVEIELVVRQISQALGGLQKQGVVHLNLRPDTIFVRTTEAGLEVVLGGFETATLIEDAAGSVEVSMDPYYAPPEAIGLYHYTREPGLRAWDWWSFGRVLQEIVLGRHILGRILERDVTRATPELRTRAENLLKEQDPTMRAGAVEMMPAMERELTALLRGLLTTSREGRWGFAEVEGWLRKELAKDRYNLPRNERLFIWKDRAYTVSEAAEYFTSAAHWEDGTKNLFDSSNPATLAYFIGHEAAQKKTKERFELLMKLGDAPALQQLPPEISSDVVMALVLKFLTGHHAPLILRGRRVDEAYLRALLAPEAQPFGLGTVYGLTARPIVQQIEQFDVEVGRMLGELERIYEAAATLAEKNGWLSTNDAVQMATLMILCMESEPMLSKTRAEMIKRYACSRDLTLDKLFKKHDADKAELSVIAYTLRESEKFGYVTHREWNQERYRVLSERGEQLAGAGLWLQLGHALRLGLFVFGRWRLCIPVWCAAALALALVGQNLVAYVLAGASVVAALLVRIVWFGYHRAKLQHRLHGSRLWTLRSGWMRCREEAKAILKADSLPGPRELLKLLSETNAEIAKLTLDPLPKPIPMPPAFRDTKTVALASWVMVLALSGGTIFYGIKHPPKIPSINWHRLTQMWSSNTEAKVPSRDETLKSKLAVERAPDVGVKSIQSTLDELRRAKREADKQAEPLVRVSWPFKTPVEAQVVRVHANSVALPEQVAVAEEMGQLLLDRYDPTTTNAIIAVQVPAEKEVGLMLYDGRTKKLADRKVYTIGFVPFAKSWIEIDSKKVIFLGGL